MYEIKFKVQCPHCESPNIVKNGTKITGKQNFLCKGCRKQFQFAYQYQGADPGVKKQVISSLIHGSGIRDCSAVFKISQATVLRTIIRKAEGCQLIPRQKHYGRIILDELYSFVHSKDKKVWIFYAYSADTKEILAFTMGKRNIRQLRFLMLKIKHLKINVDYWCTDAFDGFKAVLFRYNHLIGKEFTKAIEGRNTCIRARLARFQRRSTKFSKKLLFQWNLFLIFVHWLNSQSSYI